MKSRKRMLSVELVVCGWVVFLMQSALSDEKVPPKLWEATVAAGLSITEGNSKNVAANVALDAVRVAARNEWLTGASCAYAETQDQATGNTQKSAQNAKAFGNYKHKFKEMFIYSDNSVFHDELAEVDYRVIVGAGGGRYFVDLPGEKISVEAGAADIHETFAAGDHNDAVALR